MVARVCLKIMIGLSLALSQSVVIADINDLSVTARQLVSKKRVSRTDIEYTYTITVSNAGAPLTGVAVAVSSLSAKSVITEGEVLLGELASGSGQSSDTFTMRQNRRVRFNPADLVYTFTADTPVVNNAPIANAGADQTALVGDTVTMSGATSSDSDGDPLSYSWSIQSQPAGSTASLSDSSTASPSFVADQVGSYVVELIVNDGTDNSTPVLVTITADAPNVAPIANAGADQTALIGDTITLSGTASSDSDGDPLSYSWFIQSQPAGSTASLSDSSTASPSFVADQVGSYVVELIVNDGTDSSIPVLVTITVNPVITQPNDHYSCTLEPRHFQLPAANAPTVGQQASIFSPDSASFPGQILALDLIPETAIEGFYTDLDGNGFGDLVIRTPGSSSLQIWLSDNNGLLEAPVNYAIGSQPLTALVIGDFIGDTLPDIAVADSIGTVDLLEGFGGAAFLIRSEHSISVGNPVTRLVASDLDGDGDDDLLVSTDVGVAVFQQDNDLINRDLINNGNFSQGLTAWTTESVGHADGTLAGTVGLANGAVLLSENSSFRTTLKQSFIIPNPAHNLTFDLLAVDLDGPQGGIPDAFEVSLLDIHNNPIVPTVDAAATAFLNINPGGIENLANGVTKSGTLVTLDLSAAIPGTAVTLYFDLIGNPPGASSTASIGYVNAGNVVTAISSFTGSDLSGPFATLAGVGSCDVDNDNLADILVHDPGNYQLLIYGLDQNGSFTRKQTISLNGL